MIRVKDLKEILKKGILSAFVYSCFQNETRLTPFMFSCQIAGLNMHIHIVKEFQR